MKTKKQMVKELNTVPLVKHHNDLARRTKEEVKDLYNEAIKLGYL